MKKDKLEQIGTIVLGDTVAKIRIHPTEPMLAVAMAERDEVRLLSWSDQGKIKEVARIGTSKKVSDRPQQQRIIDMAFSPDGATLAVVGDRRAVERYRCVDGQPIEKLGSEVVDPEWRIEEAKGRLSEELWEETLPYTKKRIYANPLPENYTCVIYSADGRYLAAAASEASHAQLWSTKTGEQQQTFWGASDQAGYALHPEHRLLASIETAWGERMKSGTVRFGLFEEGSYQAFDLSVMLYMRPYGLRFSPDGKLLACVGIDRSLALSVIDFPSCEKLYDWEDCTALRKPLLKKVRSPRPWIEQVIFSPDSSKILLPFPTGQLLELEARTGEARRKFEVHDGFVISCDGRLDDGIVTTASLEGTISLWRSPYASQKEPALDGHVKDSVTYAYQQLAKPIAATPDWGLRYTEEGEEPDTPIVELGEL